MQIKLQVGDKVVVRKDKRYFRAKITEVWPSLYDTHENGIIEIEYESLFGIVRELVDSCYVNGVKTP